MSERVIGFVLDKCSAPSIAPTDLLWFRPHGQHPNLVYGAYSLTPFLTIRRADIHCDKQTIEDIVIAPHYLLDNIHLSSGANMDNQLPNPINARIT